MNESADGGLRGTASHETIRKVLNGQAIPHQSGTVEAIVLALCDAAGVETTSRSACVADVMTAWEAAIDAPPASTGAYVPEPLSTPQPAVQGVAVAGDPRGGPIPVTRQARAVILSDAACNARQIVEDYQVALGNYGAESVRNVYVRLETPWEDRDRGRSLDPLPVLAAGEKRTLEWDMRYEKIRVGRPRAPGQMLELFDVRVHFEDLDGAEWVTTLQSGGPWSVADAAEQIRARRGS